MKIGKTIRVATEFSHPGCNFEMSLLKNRLYELFYRNDVPVYPNYRLIAIDRRSVLLRDNYADTDRVVEGIDSVVILYPRMAHTTVACRCRIARKSRAPYRGLPDSAQHRIRRVRRRQAGKEHVMMDHLRSDMGEASRELDRCMSCGLCLQDCPTYSISGRFTSSPRGRIRLMKSLSEGTITLADKVPYADVTVQHELDTCLGCLGCVTSCPADIRHSEIQAGLEKDLFDQDPKYREQLGAFLKEMPIDNPSKMRALDHDAGGRQGDRCNLDCAEHASEPSAAGNEEEHGQTSGQTDSVPSFVAAVGARGTCGRIACRR